jgi:glycosyltransferase involved in cell wall biosynthesis
VRQRNIGIERAKGDVVFFADDDAVYSDGYAQAILNVYQDDREGLTGGVQGAIDDFDLGPAERCGFSRVFMLPRFGKGRLQLSAWPAFIRPAKELSQVEVFSGPAMSYRKEVLREFRFNEAFKQYWMGDDFEMAYRVSRKYRLFHQPQARLNHYLSAASREGERRKCKMAVVNHYYLSRAIFGYGLKPRLAWFWSEVGLWLVALLCLFSGRGVTRLMGMFDGYTELLSIRRKR